MRRAFVIGLLVGTTVLSGCAQLNRINPFQRGTGAEVRLPYRTQVRVDDGRDLTVTARDSAGATVAMVRESVRHPVTRHCLTRRGSSEADWQIDPANGEWAFSRDGQGNMIFRARCRA